MIYRIQDLSAQDAHLCHCVLTLECLHFERDGLDVRLHHDELLDVATRADEIFRHVYRVYPTMPSPYYAVEAVA